MSDRDIRSLERVWMVTGGYPSGELQAAWRRVGRCYACGGSNCLDPCLTVFTEIMHRLARSVGISVEEAARNLTKALQKVNLSILEANEIISKFQLSEDQYES